MRLIPQKDRYEIIKNAMERMEESDKSDKRVDLFLYTASIVSLAVFGFIIFMASN